MGQCGCGDYSGGFRFPGPDGSIYLLSWYPGCEYCQFAPGWTIELYPEGDYLRESFEVDSEPPLAFRGDGIGTALPTMDFGRFKGKLAEIFDGADIQDDQDAKWALSDELLEELIKEGELVRREFFTDQDRALSTTEE